MMKEPFGGLILNVAFRMLVPFTIVYGVYVLCLGEFSPGGGFQAGALLSHLPAARHAFCGDDAEYGQVLGIAVWHSCRGVSVVSESPSRGGGGLRKPPCQPYRRPTGFGS